MTAEVAILNKSAVALAADSKVSIGGSRPQKTYDSQNKIFTLSKIHPVGIMIYNNADFMSYPWETIIKQYRKQKADRNERTAEAWADNFVRYLRSFGNIRAGHIRENVIGVLYSTFDQIEIDASYYAVKENIQIGTPAYNARLLELVEDRIQQFGASGFHFTRAASLRILNTYSDQILEAVARFVPSAANRKLIDASVDLGALALISKEFSPISSGFVIAGFGEQEVFPSLIEFETDGYIGRQIKLKRIDTVNITREGTDAAVRAFAQRDIVYRFMEGIAPEYAIYLQGLFLTELVQTNLRTFDRWAPRRRRTPAARRAVERGAIRQFEIILERSRKYREDEYWYPTVGMVAVLPKDEMAHLAESMVELTALHRRASTELETVGGDIDVAIISKGDGFIWYKRKHYFDLAFNRQFELNYMRDV